VPALGQPIVKRAIAAKDFDSTAANNEPVLGRFAKVQDRCVRFEILHIDLIGNSPQLLCGQDREGQMLL